MLLNFILLLIVIIAIILLIKQLRKPNVYARILPICNFVITKPCFDIKNNIRIVTYSIITKGKIDRYFRDFPMSFRFYSTEKFRSKIKITYISPGDDEKELIYDKLIEFEDNTKEHIYYLSDVIVGSIDIEIYTNSIYGKPTILFELLQGNMCHMIKEHKLEIVFPK